MRKLGLGLLVAMISLNSSPASAQPRDAGRGATVEGERLRGEGVFLQGLGSWELNDARAREIDAKTGMAVSNWYIQYYDSLQKKYNASVDRKNKNYQKLVDAQKQRQTMLRTNPSPQDVQNGDALNVLLADLSDPKIAPSAWRLAKVPLPPAVSIRKLAFRFADKDGQGSRFLKSNEIAIGRLDLAGHWPGYLPENRIGQERRSYEAVYGRLVAACEQNQPILDLAIDLRKEIDKLKSRVGSVIPKEGKYQEYADRFAGDMKAAAEVFNAETMDFASDFISDSHRHEAETVGDLLAFMRKYRLYFAPSKGNPDMIEAYNTLYPLLRQQVEELGVKPIQEAPIVRANPQATIYSGSWKIQGNELVQNSLNGGAILAFGDPSWSSYNLTFETKLEEGKSCSWTFINFENPANHINFYLVDGAESIIGMGNVVNNQCRRNDEKMAIESNRWYRIEIQVRGRISRSFLNGIEVLNNREERLSSGKIGLGSYFSRVRFRNVQVTSPEGKNLYKGLPSI